MRTTRPEARFVRLGGALELRTFWVRRHEGGGVSDTAWGEVENTSDVVVCADGDALRELSLRVDGSTSSTALFWAPAHDDGSGTSVACLAPGERGVFRAALDPVLAGDFSPQYSRVEYDFGAIARPDAVPHSLAPELVDVVWTDDDSERYGGQATLRMRAEGTIADIELQLFARDVCGALRLVATAVLASAAPPVFEVATEVDSDPRDPSELVVFPRFRTP